LQLLTVHIVYFGRVRVGEHRVQLEDFQNAAHRHGCRDDIQVSTPQACLTPQRQQNPESAAIHERDVGEVDGQAWAVFPDDLERVLEQPLARTEVDIAANLHGGSIIIPARVQ
jgi:hypothetical protein